MKSGVDSYISYGSVYYNQSTFKKAKYNISNCIVHPDYLNGRFLDPIALINDIMLCKIDGEFEFDNKYVGPICLPKQGAHYDGRAVVAGWGVIGPVNFTERIRMSYVETNLLNEKYCNHLKLDSHEKELHKRSR